MVLLKRLKLLVPLVIIVTVALWLFFPNLTWYIKDKETPVRNSLAVEAREYSSHVPVSTFHEQAVLKTSSRVKLLLSDLETATLKQAPHTPDGGQTVSGINDLLINQHKNESRFQVRSLFRLPVPHSTLPLTTILQQSWMNDLKDVLYQIDPNSGPISITTCDYNFREILLNWLIASTVKISPALSHALVFSMDKSVYDLLKSHNINCLYVPPESFVRKSITLTLKRHIAFSEVQILRLTIMRFLNHWGYDVANYDADAIVMKNPEPLYYETYKDSDLIASYGHYPAEVKVKWGGITLCAGMFMVKSGSATETFWNAMNAVLPNSYNDQARLNNALVKLDVQWGDSRYRDILINDWHGSTGNGLRVTVLPALKICRQTCNRIHKKEYYVWHKGGSGKAGKVKYAHQGGLWFLRSDWEIISNHSTVKGLDWLRTIAIPSPL